MPESPLCGNLNKLKDMKYGMKKQLLLAGAALILATGCVKDDLYNRRIPTAER